MSNNISTTPAGPPPSSAPSFTPAGQPPSTVFGSSIFGATGPSKLRFTDSASDTRSSVVSDTNNTPRSFFQPRNNTPAKPSSLNNFQVPSSSPLTGGADSSPVSSRPLHGHGYTDFVNTTRDGSSVTADRNGASNFDFRSMLAARPGSQLRHSYGARSPLGSSKAPKKKSPIANQGVLKLSELPRKGKESAIPVIARNLAKRRKTATLVEQDEMVLQTNSILSKLSEDTLDSDGLVSLDNKISAKSAELVQLWDQVINNDSSLTSNLFHAVEISSLWLGVRHPPPKTDVRKSLNRFSRDISVTQYGQEFVQQPVPRVLLDWIDHYHPTLDESLEAVRTMRPNCTAHEFFWETLHALAVRGKITEIVRLLHEADFKFASSAILDGQEDPGYSGAQLQSVQGAINRVRQMLEMCPAVCNDDWSTIGADWAQYRNRVTSDLAQLVQIAEGGDDFPDENDEVPRVDDFSVTGTRTNLAQTARQAMSRIPWNVYESLKILYRIILGSTAEILAVSQDYLEASIGLTVWWDGAENDRIHNWTMSVARQSRAADPGQGLSFQNNPYVERLKLSFLYVTDPETSNGLSINPEDEGEVGLASALQGDADSMIGILQTLSIVVASATAEIGVAACWLGASSGPALDMMDEDDMDVLNYGQEETKITKDEILSKYVDFLSGRKQLDGGTVTKEGWEIAISVAKRLHDHKKPSQTVNGLFDQLQISSQDRMDKVLRVCTDLGLIQEARKVSEVSQNNPSTLLHFT